MSKERQQQLKGAKYNDSDEEELSLDLDSDELGGQDDTLDDLSDNDSEYHLGTGTKITFNLQNNKEHGEVEQLDQIEELEKQIAMMKMDQKDEDKNELSLGKELDDFLEELDIHSSANETSTISKSIDDKSKKDITKSILKNEKLKAMSTEIYKPSVNAKVGKVVSIRVSKKYTAFGTDRGLILIFSSDDQELKCILGNTTGVENVSTGKVSSLSFSFQEDWLVAGYEKGVIIVWDVLKASVIKRIDDAFTSPVVNVAFLTDMYSIIASELFSSTLKCFALSKVLFRYSYSLMFQMSVGDDPIITFAVIPKDYSKSYLAVGTRSGKLLLYSMGKTLVPDGDPVSFGYPLYGKGLLPYLALANSSSNSKTGIVAFAYGKDVHIIDISKDGKKDIIFNSELTSDVCGLGWFDEKSLVVMTADQEVLLFDVRVDDTSVIETEDITFTNPLDHYAMQGSKHSSYDINSRGFVVLGEHGLVKISIKPWEERIYQLSDAGLWKEALELTHEFYTGKGKCVFGLPADAALDILAAKTVGLVTEYLRLSLTGSEYKDDYIYKLVGSTCIDNCMKVGREDVVFSAVHTTFEECGKTQIFLELLEPFILSGALKSIPWPIFQGFISNFKTQQERLDTLIMRLDLQQYNMYDKIIQFCRECSLLKTYVHVTNIYQREYVEPLERILEEYGESREREVAEVILYFFERYLVGNVPEHEDLVTDIKKDVVDFIFDEEEDGGRDPTSAFHSIVRHYPEKLFDVLEIAMNDDSATNPWDEDFTQENLIEYILRLQLPHQFMKHPSFYDGRIAFFSFYAKFLAKGILKAEDYNILLVIFTFLSEDILRRLRNCTDDKEKQRILSLREDREERFIEILEKRKTYYDKTKFMELAKRFDLYKLAKFFMSSTQKYQWYLEVNLKRLFEITWSQIPELAETLVVDLSFSNACHQHVVMTVQKLLDEERDPERYRTLRFFFYCYITSLLLDPTSENGSLNMNEVAKRGISVEELTYTYLQMVCDFEDNKKVKEYLQQQGSGLDVDKCMKICKDVPEAKSFLLERTGEVKHALNEILRELEHTVDLLKLKLIDEVSRKRNAAFEKNFDEISKDFNLITDDPPVYCPNEPIIEQMKVLQQKPKIKLPKVTLKEGYDAGEKAELTDVLTCHESRNLVKELKTAINLCCENSERKTLDDSEVRQLWFRLLNTFVLLQRKLRYGFLEGKPLSVSKREESSVFQKKIVDSEGFDEFDLEDTQLDEFDIIKEEIVDTNTEIIKIEKDLNAERELHDPDEERIERLQIKLKKKKDHIHNLQMQLKSLEEKEKLEKQLEEERNNDPTAPHNIQKLANLWLQRCNSLYIRIILSEMMRYVDIPSILNDIVTEHDSDAFGNVKVTIMRLLDNYSYESGLLKQSNELISYDIFNIGNQLHRDLNSALKPNSLYCFLCGNPLGKKTMEESSMCRIFPCGHAFHVNCIGIKQVACVHCENKDEKELIQIAKTSRTYIMEGRKVNEEEVRGKFFDFHQVKSTVDKALDKRPPIDLLDDLSLKKKGGNAKKKNAADIALEQLSAPSSSSVTRLTGVKILQLAPENLGNGRSNNRSNANKVTLVAIDEHAEDEILTRDRTSTLTQQKTKRRIGPIQKITIVDFEEIVKEIEEMYD